MSGSVNRWGLSKTVSVVYECESAAAYKKRKSLGGVCEREYMNPDCD